MNYLSTKLYSAFSNPSLRDYRKSSSFHASAASVTIPNSLGGQEIVGACNRQQYLRIKDVPRSDIGETDWNIAALLGEKVHDLAVDLINDHGFTMGLQILKAEHPFFDPRINLSGRCDILCWDYNQQMPIGIEVKSVGEYKAGKVLESPQPEHVLQAMLYLDYYKNTIPDNQKAPERWYIWYFARTESWAIKGKKHGSPFTMLWDFYITLSGPEKTVTVHTPNGPERWEHFNINNIHRRYHELKQAVTLEELPPRDFDLQYSVEKIVGMYKHGKLEFKKYTEPVKKWLDKGSPEGKLKLAIGDFECRVCPWKSHCWDLNFSGNNQKGLFSLPKKANTKEKSTPPEVIL